MNVKGTSERQQEILNMMGRDLSELRHAKYSLRLLMKLDILHEETAYKIVINREILDDQ